MYVLIIEEKMVIYIYVFLNNEILLILTVSQTYISTYSRHSLGIEWIGWMSMGQMKQITHLYFYKIGLWKKEKEVSKLISFKTMQCIKNHITLDKSYLY